MSHERVHCVLAKGPTFQSSALEIRHMIADDSTRQAVQTVIEATYEALSTPGSDVAELFGAADIAIAGYGRDELWAGPAEVVEAATAASSWARLGWIGTTGVLSRL